MNSRSTEGVQEKEINNMSKGGEGGGGGTIELWCWWRWSKQ